MASERWPDFFIIGAAKAGTTTLYGLLNAHPDVHMSDIKEPRYFAFQHQKPDPEDPIFADSVTDTAVYLDLFAGAQANQMIGEASPIYLHDPQAPKAIAKECPSARLIVILRDPVERAFSHFQMSQRQGYEPESDFLKALQASHIQLGKWRRERPYLPYSRYAEGLACYLDHFPKEQILVLFMDELRSEPEKLMARLCEFIGVPVHSPPPQQAHQNKGYAVKNPRLTRAMRHPVIRKAARFFPDNLVQRIKQALRRANMTEARLSADRKQQAYIYFRHDIEYLEEMFGIDLSHWRP